MTPQEKSMVEDLFGRIRTNGAPERDREADALIGQMMNGTPGAAYALVQTVLVQDAALRQAKAQLQQVQQGQDQPGGRSFLGGQGGGQQDDPQPAPQQAQRGGFFGGPWGSSQPQQPQSGGFLQGALQTAAGVAGGALLFDGVRSLFGGGGLGGLGGLGGGFGGFGGARPTEETVVNNYYGDDAGAQPGFDPGGDGGYDPGGDGSWSDGGSGGDDSGWV